MKFVTARPSCSGSIRKLEGRKVRMHRRGRRKDWEAEERNSSKIR